MSCVVHCVWVGGSLSLSRPLSRPLNTLNRHQTLDRTCAVVKHRCNEDAVTEEIAVRRRVEVVNQLLDERLVLGERRDGAAAGDAGTQRGKGVRVQPQL